MTFRGAFRLKSFSGPALGNDGSTGFLYRVGKQEEF